MQTETQNITEVQKGTIRRLQQENEDYQAKQLVTESKLAELESLLSWERLQHRNQVQSLQGQLDEKETKLKQLSKTVEIKEGVSKIQAQVKQIYVENSSLVQSSLQEVARRARSPVGSEIRYISSFFHVYYSFYQESEEDQKPDQKMDQVKPQIKALILLDQDSLL